MFIVLVLLAPACLHAAVSHQVSFPDRNTQYVNIESEFPADGERVELIMPNWTPGSYQIRDYATHIEGFTAQAGDGTPLAFDKVSKNRWLIETNGAATVTVAYRKWAGSLSVQDNWVEGDFALLNPAGVFMFSEQTRSMPQSVAVQLPTEWADLAVALPGPDGSGRYSARDYDELVDSPMLAGNFSRRSFDVEGAAIGLVTYGETAYWNSDEAVTDLAKISKAHLDFWGVNPFEREFLFINVLMNGRGGLEHDHSTVIMANATAMRHRDEYVKWMALASHEFFHAWNVRRMRPAALAEYNYQDEVYTRQLWVAEGLTSYYDNLLLFRAAVITVQEFFDLLAVEMQQYEAQPGRLKISAESASFDSWIKHYRNSPNAVNSYSNYYRKGALIGFVVDTAIREATRNRQSLDVAMQRMYEQYGPSGEGAGSYPEGALSRIVADLAGEEVGRMLEDLRSDAIDPDVDAALAWYGLKLVRDSERSAAIQAGNPVPVDFGVTWQPDVPQLIVETVFESGAGADAGIVPGDELLAIDGFRVTRDNHVTFMNGLRSRDVVTVTLSRHGRLIERMVATRAALPAKYLITTQERVSNAEERRLENWLGRSLLIKQ